MKSLSIIAITGLMLLGQSCSQQANEQNSNKMTQQTQQGNILFN